MPKLKPYTCACRHGITITAAEATDTALGPITIKVPPSTLKPEFIAQAVAEFIGSFAAHRLPEMKGFAGYDALTFTIERTGPKT